VSETKHWAIHCDAPGCYTYEMGDVWLPPSRIRAKLARKGWLSRTTPPNAWQRENDIMPTAKQDFCPVHAARAAQAVA
jgi:hypothetical protein